MVAAAELPAQKGQGDGNAWGSDEAPGEGAHTARIPEQGAGAFQVDGGLTCGDGEVRERDGSGRSARNRLNRHGPGGGEGPSAHLSVRKYMQVAVLRWPLPSGVAGASQTSPRAHLVKPYARATPSTLPRPHTSTGAAPRRAACCLKGV